METAVVKIRGMTCTGCVNSVKNVLQKISGVSSADVSLGIGLRPRFSTTLPQLTLTGSRMR